jgi:hypothetical protein
MRNVVQTACLFVGIGAVQLSPGARAIGNDWPQWRGPNRDGFVGGAKIPEKWPRAQKEDWKAPVGEGYASPVVVGDNVYVFTRQKDDEFVRCFDIAGGKEIWRSEARCRPGEHVGL